MRITRHPYRRLAATLAVATLALTGACGSEADDSRPDAAPNATTGGVPSASDNPARVFAAHAVIGTADALDATPSASGNTVLADVDGGALEIGPAVIDAADVTTAKATEAQGAWLVEVTLAKDASKEFGALTAEAACAQGERNRIALVVAGKVVSSPAVAVACGSEITDAVQIAGDFSEDEATKLAAELTR